MAKKMYGYTGAKDERGVPIASEIAPPTRHQRKSTQRLIPLTPAPKTRGQKIARALWG